MPDIDSLVAVMVATPGAIAETTPFCVTVAALLFDDQVTV
jgi:hypothetical protein